MKFRYKTIIYNNQERFVPQYKKFLFWHKFYKSTLKAYVYPNQFVGDFYFGIGCYVGFIFKDYCLKFLKDTKEIYKNHKKYKSKIIDKSKLDYEMMSVSEDENEKEAYNEVENI